MSKQHQCRLTTGSEPVEIIDQVIDSGMFIELRRNLLRWTMISRSHPTTSFYFRSNMAIGMEEMRHVFNYLYIIHPFSMLSLYWEFLLIIVYSMAYIMVCVSSTDVIEISTDDGVFCNMIFLDIILTIDISKTFLTGFYDEKLTRIVLKPSLIAKKYLKGYFLVDFLAIISTYTALCMLAIDREIPLMTTYIVNLGYCFKIFRIGRCLDAIELLSSYAGLSGVLSKVLRTVFICGTSWL
ncbi:hypothetical protein JTB14_034768 [Gonioctena quinquepunctata]|nr:hypothetical protein JTB14_034768 [Gonioctena quinquepunctata]